MKIYNSKILLWCLNRLKTSTKLDLYLLLEDFNESGFGERDKPNWLWQFRLLLFSNLFRCMLFPMLTDEISGVVPMDGPCGMVFQISFNYEYEEIKD
tara:strand:+ start:670 stop:960 length:291 start_codon:yes stop_codon:yes gene_type:complete